MRGIETQHNLCVFLRTEEDSCMGKWRSGEKKFGSLSDFDLAVLIRR